MFTERQKMFIEAYNGNATEAAIAAGYSKKTAGVQGHHLLKNPKIVAAIQARTEEKVEALVADRQERLEFLTAMMRNEEEPSPVRLKAADLMCKASGDYLNKTEISGPNGRPMTIAELMAEDDEPQPERNYHNLTEEEMTLLLALTAKLEGDFTTLENMKSYCTWLKNLRSYTPKEAALRTQEALEKERMSQNDDV